jgi:dephospho-CoA kinase
VDLLGFVGTFAAGKDQAAEYLLSKGWNIACTGDILRMLAVSSGLDLSRETLQTLGNKVRTERGPGILVLIAVQVLPRPLVITGLRGIHEVAVIKGNDGLVVSFDAPRELRFRRIMQRGRPDDPRTMEEFVAMQSVESSDDPNSQNIPAVMKMADRQIWNNFSHTDHLHNDLDRILKSLIH